MRSISLSVRAGMIGATMTATGTPASAQRLDGLQALAAGWRPAAPSCGRSLRSSVVTEIATLARPRLAMRARISMSRTTSADLVTMPTGMAGAVQHLEDRAGDAVLALDRLVGVGDGAERDVLRHVARVGQLPLQQLGGVDLGVELGLEVEAGRVAEVAVRGPGEAIDAAVLAAAIGVDGLVEADVGAVVAWR